MKTLLALSIMLSLIGCAEKDNSTSTPESKLLGLRITFSTNESIIMDTAYYSNSGYRMWRYEDYSTGYCSSFGQWYDLNPGQNQGKVCLKVFYNQCPGSYVGAIVSYKYVITDSPTGLVVVVHDEYSHDDVCRFN